MGDEVYKRSKFIYFLVVRFWVKCIVNVDVVLVFREDYIDGDGCYKGWYCRASLRTNFITPLFENFPSYALGL